MEKYIEHTLLKPDATQEEVKQLLDEAIEYSFLGVCINPSHIKFAKEYLKNSDIKIVTVIGFPLGANVSDVKAFETQKAVEDGADEIDMVINIGALKENNLPLVESDIIAVVEMAQGKPVKVIIETDLLTKEEIVIASKIVAKAGAQFVKTSTGFVKGGVGAKAEDVKAMYEAVSSLGLQVKASGGSPLAGYGNKASQLSTILKHFNSQPPEPLSAQNWESREERRLQSWLIKQAFLNNRSLLKPLKLQGVFDELIFCLDEVSLGDKNHPVIQSATESTPRPDIVRCDLLAMGINGGVCSPVLIELKYKRELSRLTDQLDNFIREVNETGEINRHFIELMKTCAGIDDSVPLNNEFKKIIVWPKGNARQSTLDKLKANHVLQVEYSHRQADYHNIDTWWFGPFSEAE